MKASIRNRLEQLDDRQAELDALLGAEEATRDMAAFLKLTKERAEVAAVVELFAAYRLAEADRATAAAMENDAEMREFARAEAAAAQETMARLESDLQRMLLPRDPNDDKSIFLEIRAGTGGDESALFAGDLFRMYARFAERQRWKVEVVSKNESDLGGYREIIARIEGPGAYARLKFESGGHRVQRVPAT
jgi:peptide chain release factor 1